MRSFGLGRGIGGWDLALKPGLDSISKDAGLGPRTVLMAACKRIPSRFSGLLPRAIARDRNKIWQHHLLNSLPHEIQAGYGAILPSLGLVVEHFWGTRG